MTNKLSYMHKGCTGKVCFLDSSDILFHFSQSGRRTQPSSIHLNSQPYNSDTRWFRLILYDPYFTKNSFTPAIKRLATKATKKDLGPFKLGRALAVVDSNRSVNLLFNIRKILFYLSFEQKRYEVFKCFRSATCHRSCLES